MSQSKNNQDIKNELLSIPDDEFYKMMEDAGFELVKAHDGKGGIIFTDYAVVKGSVIYEPWHQGEDAALLVVKDGDGWQTEDGEIKDLDDILAKFKDKRVRLTVETIEDWE